MLIVAPNAHLHLHSTSHSISRLFCRDFIRFFYIPLLHIIYHSICKYETFEIPLLTFVPAKHQAYQYDLMIAIGHEMHVDHNIITPFITFCNLTLSHTIHKNRLEPDFKILLRIPKYVLHVVTFKQNC